MWLLRMTRDDFNEIRDNEMKFFFIIVGLLTDTNQLKSYVDEKIVSCFKSCLVNKALFTIHHPRVVA